MAWKSSSSSMKGPSWHRILLLILLVAESVAADGGSIQFTQFIPVSYTPASVSKSTILYVREAYLCSNRCLRHGACQGILIMSNEIHPCKLLHGLTGLQEVSAEGVSAYVHLNYNGVHYQRRITSQSWTQGKKFCEDLGMKMVSYPTSDQHRSWLQAVTDNNAFIGGKKNPSDSNRIYDINTNTPLEIVDFSENVRSTDENVLILRDGVFQTVNDQFLLPEFTLLCSP